MNANITYRLVAIICLLTLLFSCGGKEQDLIDFERIDALCETDPHRAIQLLDSIPEEFLSEKALYRHRLLSIKANDKAYIKHTSDSLICKVIDYYSSQKGSPLYPEALYYGGRVYSDMGVSEKVLEYFQLAADELSESNNNLKLESAVHSQYGRILHKLNYNKDAKIHLERAIELNRILSDTINEVHNLHLLGLTMLQMRETDRALKLFSELCKKSNYLSKRMAIKSKMYLALAEMKNDNLDSALHIVHKCVEEDERKFTNSMVAIASQIYYKSGIYDKAYINAKKLIEDLDSVNRKIGYQILITPELKKYSSSDSIDFYMNSYASLIENAMNENEKIVSMSNTFLSTSNVEKVNVPSIEWVWILCIVVAVIVLLLIVVRRKLRSRSVDADKTYAQCSMTGIEEQFVVVKTSDSDNCEDNAEALDDEKAISYNQGSSNENPLEDGIGRNGDNMESVEKSCMHEEAMKKRMIEFRENVLKTVLNDKSETKISEALVFSKSYKNLMDLIHSGQPINNNRIWDDLANEIMSIYPDFKNHLLMLMGCNLAKEDFRTCLLIKCNISPSQIGTLMSVSPSGIASRRRKFCKLAYSENIDLKTMDKIIRSL